MHIPFDILHSSRVPIRIRLSHSHSSRVSMHIPLCFLLHRDSTPLRRWSMEWSMEYGVEYGVEYGYGSDWITRKNVCGCVWSRRVGWASLCLMFKNDWVGLWVAVRCKMTVWFYVPLTGQSRWRAAVRGSPVSRWLAVVAICRRASESMRRV
jgi:hypothetical protein